MCEVMSAGERNWPIGLRGRGQWNFREASLNTPLERICLFRFYSCRRVVLWNNGLEMIKEKWFWMWQEVGISPWGQIWPGWLTQFSLSQILKFFFPSNYLGSGTDFSNENGTWKSSLFFSFTWKRDPALWAKWICLLDGSHLSVY